MIRATGRTADGRPLIVVGLSAENVRRLQANKPIRADWPDGSQVVVLYGETEDDITEDLRALGWFHDSTVEVRP
jgi:hypothetical protein